MIMWMNDNVNGLTWLWLEWIEWIRWIVKSMLLYNLIVNSFIDNLTFES